MQHSAFILCAFLLPFFFTGCSQEEQPRHAKPAPTTQETSTNAVAGLTWDVPEDNWQVEGQRQMRVATFSTPAADGDTDKGEVAIFYFGPGEGGSVQANVERWFGQFDHPDLSGEPTREVATRESMEVNNIAVTIVRTAGTYNAAAGPMAPRQDIRPGYKLIGAIAEGPQGAVFFKFTGPEATVQKAEQQFMQMVQSIRRQ